MKKRVVTIIGARPQFIKASTLSREIKNHDVFEEIVIHTGQHFDKNMSDIFFDELKISKPKYNFDINSCSHGKMTGQMLIAIEEVFLNEKPDLVLVYGDTNSTLAGAIAASKLNIPLAHVEAGLRSFNRKMPEEINRLLTDHLSKFLFCPTKQALKNLKIEGITNGVYHTGDIMYDATIFAKDYINKNFKKLNNKFKIRKNEFGLMTIHRQESVNNKIQFSKLFDYADKFSKKNNIKILFPVHPRTKDLIKEYMLKSNFSFLDPLSYFEIQYLLSNAFVVLTDSGGLQKEAYFHKVPCVTFRSETEWVETIKNGWNRLWTENHYKSRQKIFDYGDGNGAKNIINILLEN